MAQVEFVNRCIFCGKSNSTVRRPEGSYPNTSCPSVPGKCPASPDGKHVSQWDRK